MIPQTYPSNFNSAGRARMIIYMLPSVTGLTRWIDYIPVKSPTNETNLEVANTFANDGFILTSSLSDVTGLVPFRDYVPVYLDPNATVAWSADNNGYIPMDGLASFFLNFADGTNVLDSRITFSRSSNATVTDSNGNIVFAPHNLLTFSEQFDNAAWAKADTTISANSSSAPNNTTTADTLLETATTAEHQLQGGFSTVSGITYTVSIYVKAAGRTFCRFGFTGTGFSGPTRSSFDLTTGTVVANNGGNPTITSVGNGWYRLSVTNTATSSTTGLFILQTALDATTLNFAGNTSNGLLVWGAQLNQGSLQPYYPTTVKNLLGFSEAFDNAAWTKSNSFIQTNLLTFSEQFDNAAWGKSNVTISANATLAPNGTATADKLQETAVTNFFAVDRNPSGAFSTTYTWSCYAKASERNFLSFNFSVVNVSGTFNLTTGQTTILAGSPILSATPVGNGWFRCTATFTTPASGSNILYHIVGIGLSASVVSYAGTAGSGIFVWGAQIVQGASAGDYQQTTSAALPVMYQAPNGTMTADKLVENTANAEHTISGGLPTVNIPQTFSIYAKAAERTKIAIAGAGFTAQGLSAVFDLSNGTMIANVGNGWYRCAITFNPSNTNAFIVSLVDPSNNGVYTGNGTSGVLIWGAQLSDSASLDPYVNNPVAAPSSTAYYGPRFDYDPVTRQPRGLLIEESRTNLLLQSEAFDNASWTKARATISQNVAISPDGTQDADKLVEDTTASNTHLTRQVVTVSANTTYTYSLYLKASERTTAFIQSSDNATDTNGFFVTVNLSNGTLSGGNKKGSGTFTSSAISNVGNGWYRVSITGIVDTTTTSVRYEVFLSDGTSTAYTGNGTSGLFVWGAQLEAGAFPTSYIPTTTATVTRAADVAVIQGTNFSSWYNQDQGSIFAESQTLTTTGNAFAAQISDNSYNNRILVGQSSSSSVGQVIVSGSATLEPTSNPLRSSARIKQAFGFTTNSAQLATSGVLSVQDSSGAMVFGLTRLDLGSDHAGFNRLNGTISRINYYNRRLDNSQLQAITQ